MRAKEYFTQIQKAETKLSLLQAKLRRFEELGLTITSNTSAVGGHQAGTSRVEMAAIGMVDALRALQAEIDKYTAVIADAEAVIAQVKQEKFQQILTLHYVCGWSLKSISDHLHYEDENSIYRAHGFALAEAQRILDERHGRI